ncbi:hypothetical protein BDW42DRAFT_201824 [Aspergillus taichungensis]|uniref:Uncharacterized protein n=1 Tax=Aspergillus taichungensis TaxID=482145 RepID=A0A2J5I768_9EURO|nr:hypothetical protein BDW42DRAFT_201824 [Aspergillus taichungensis]
MNWTGGPLRRHSNQRDTQLFNRKRQFQKSKSRFKARASPPELSLFTANTRQILRHKETGEESNRVPIAPPCSTTLSPIKTTTHTDLLKQQLLQNSDWAAVSAARPLQISFAPVEETGRFGKRRRLTDSDRKRLSSHQPRPEETQISWKSQYKDNLSEVGTIEKLEIRINGQRPNAGRVSCQLADKALTSSQPMLLDSEPLNTPLGDDSNKHLWEDRVLSPFMDQESIPFDSPSLYTTSKGGTSPSIEEHVLPPKRHFTLDDQLIAEKEGRLDILYHPPNGDLPRVANHQHSPPHEKKANRQDQATGDTQSSSGNHWLPNPRYTIQRAPTRHQQPTSRSRPSRYTVNRLLPSARSPLQTSLPHHGFSVSLTSTRKSDDDDNTTQPRTTTPLSLIHLQNWTFSFSRGDIPTNSHLLDSLPVLLRTTTITTDNSNNNPRMLSWPAQQ